jgi:hypothetical protein
MMEISRLEKIVLNTYTPFDYLLEKAQNFLVKIHLKKYKYYPNPGLLAELQERHRTGHVKYKLKQYSHLLNYLIMNKELRNDESSLRLEEHADTPCGRICLVLASRRGLLSKEFSRHARRNRHYYWGFSESDYNAFQRSYIEIETQYRILRVKEKLETGITEKA